jgi:small-conductance mechanosensitive channel
MSHHFWTRLVIVAIVITGSALLAKAVDWRIARLELEPGQATRYRVLRKAIFSGIVFVGAVSALLVIPQVRAVAGGVLASSAVIGLVIGFASQRTIGNVVAGILVAITQPLRLGDRVTVEGVEGIVEEIGLTYTWIRTPDNDRLVVPNERIASDSLRNSTIRSEQSLAEVKIQVPAAADLRAVVNSLLSEADEVYVTDLAEKATIVLRKRIPLHENLPYAESELRLAAAERLKDVEAVDR